jgi:peptide/nickel transport system permease protein
MYNALTYKSNWWGYIFKKFLITIVVFLVISILAFSLVRIGDFPNYAFWRMDLVTVDTINEIIHENGWDQPYITQYFQWLGGFFTGNWGISPFR